MKRKYMIAGAGAILVAVTLIGGTMAANNAQTSEAAQADISVNGLAGGIEVTSTDPVFEAESGVAATPGGDYEIVRSVKNAGGELDYDAYFKAVIYKSWLDGEESYMDTTETEDVQEDRPHVADTYYDEVEAGDIVNGWLVGYVDEEEIVLYYTKPLGVGEQSTNFVEGISFAENLGNAYMDATYSFGIEVTAVQANNGADAMASTLGIYPVMDENGVIVSVSEEKPIAAE
ncbi:MAG: hypothetical protein K6G04_07600 [Lachnospiraceae bacterium]|nr:hypothetical protein [Lachnospiraceae bacterium]